MDKNKIIEKLKIMDKICNKCDCCEVCEIKTICNKYCFESPYDAILTLEKLKGLENENI